MSNRTISPVTKTLIQGKERIANPSKWLKYILKDRDRFCALGAIQGVCLEGCTEKDWGIFYKAIEMLASTVPGNLQNRTLTSPVTQVILYNNHEFSKHEDIMAWFDRAINKSIQESI